MPIRKSLPYCEDEQHTIVMVKDSDFNQTELRVLSWLSDEEICDVFSDNYCTKYACTKCPYYEERIRSKRVFDIAKETVYGAKAKEEPMAYTQETLNYWTDRAQKISKEIFDSIAYNHKTWTLCGVPLEDIERGTVKYSDVLAAELQRVLLKEEKRFSDFGEEPKGLRSVVIFDIQFTERGKWYNYAAIRCNDGKWYTTGTKRAAGYTWDELLDFIEDVHKYRKFKVVYAQKVK